MNGMENDTSQGNMQTSSSGDAMGNESVCAVCGRESLCGGLGYVRADLPVDHPQFGQLFRCPNYQANPERREKLRKLGNLDAYKDKTFTSFDTNVPGLSPNQVNSLQDALDYAREYAQHPKGWILFEGSYGTGKTHLAAAIGNIILEREQEVIFITTPDLLDHLRSAYAPNAETRYDQMFDRLREARMLILDDLGVENPSEWAGEKLFQLLNHRYVYQLPTVVTTNVDLETIDPRLSSRLADNKLVQHVKINTPDFRTNKQKSVDELPDMSLYRDMTFDNFDTQTRTTSEERNNLENILKKVKEHIENKDKFLLLLGASGTGKTHLAAAFANETERRYIPVIMLSTTELLNYLRSSFEGRTPVSFDRRLTILQNVPVLILDDLSYESLSAWAREKVFQIIDYRYLRRYKTVITSTKELEEMDNRVRTRLSNRLRCDVIAITAAAFVDRINNKRWQPRT